MPLKHSPTTLDQDVSAVAAAVVAAIRGEPLPCGLTLLPLLGAIERVLAAQQPLIWSVVGSAAADAFVVRLRSEISSPPANAGHHRH
jgi:hypothetical protein